MDHSIIYTVQKITHPCKGMGLIANERTSPNRTAVLLDSSAGAVLYFLTTIHISIYNFLAPPEI